MAYDDQFEVHDLYELKLLEHVEKTPQLSHRQASRILGVSLKLAHDIVTRMVGKGLVHVQKHHARRWDYFLTPSGIAEKARLTVEFLEFSMHFYREARRRSAALCRQLAEAGARRISLLGANNLGEIVFLGAHEWGLEIACIYDDDCQGDFLKHPVKPSRELAVDASDAIIVCVYDAAEPMRAAYLPADVVATEKMKWIF